MGLVLPETGYLVGQGREKGWRLKWETSAPLVGFLSLGGFTPPPQAVLRADGNYSK